MIAAQLFYVTSSKMLQQSFDKIKQQEAQLLLRNRASAMYFFVAKLLSIA